MDMHRILEFIDSLSFGWLIVLAVFTAIAPWPAGPEPHLVEKTRMLLAGELTRPIDIFDLFFHAAAPLLLIAKTIRHFSR